jgi:hypothetical protein
MSYGYQPPEQDPGGSWTEVFVLTGVVFGLLAPLVAALVGIVALVVVTIVLMGQQPSLGLIPVALVVAGATWMLRRERQKADAEAARGHGD